MKKLILLLAVLPLVFASCEKDKNSEVSQGKEIDKVFPDKVFRQRVSEWFDSDKDGRLSDEEIDQAYILYCPDLNIESMAGIEVLVNLTQIDCSGCQLLKSLDLSQNVKLQSVDTHLCSNLESITLGKNVDLFDLNLTDCNLTDIKTDGETVLNVENFNCAGNNLEKLGCLAQMPKLKSLNCNFNNITELDLSKQTNLKSLKVCCNRLTRLKPTIVNGGELDCHDNPFGKMGSENLDLSNASKLWSLNCSLCKLENLNPEWMPSVSLDCAVNKLTTIDFSKMDGLEHLDIAYNKFEPTFEIPASILSKLISLGCGKSGLAKLDIAALNPSLNILLFSDIQMEELDLSKLVQLKELSCNNCGISTIKFGSNKLTSIHCSGNDIATLDLTQMHNLRYLEAYSGARIIKYCKVLEAELSIYCDANTYVKVVPCEDAK